MTADAPVVLDVDGLRALVELLWERDYEVVGPQVRDGAVVSAPLDDVDQLPHGWRDEQAPGRYRLRDERTPARFAWAVGPRAWKPLLHPPTATTVRIRRRPRPARGSDESRITATEQIEVRAEPRPEHRRALLGIRPCDAAAIARLDGVLLDGVAPDPVYAANRSSVVRVVVECTHPAATCFCPSMGTGPALPPDTPHDIVLTELVDDGAARYVTRAGSEIGRELLAAVVERAGGVPADADALESVGSRLAAARASIRRHLAGDGLPVALVAAHDQPAWDDVAERCLACGNCTAVCPTCFCTDVREVTDLAGTEVERRRTWATCFDPEFSRLGARTVRASLAARYRQWLTHKLGTWHEQFGESGCVGCGRCITWCPVGIDLTAEVPAVLAVAPDGRDATP